MEHVCDKMKDMDGVKITGGLVPARASNHYYDKAWYLHFGQAWSYIEYCPYCGKNLVQGE